MKRFLVILVLMRWSVSPAGADSIILLRSQPSSQQTPLVRTPQTPSPLNLGLDSVLKGIALVESRRGDQPWPWTLNVAGKPYFFIDRESAWNATQRLQKHQWDNFDIGVMQVNWHFHKHRFKNTWEALDPVINQRVAKTILLEQWQVTGHLPTAIARYHSANPHLGIPYLKRVLEAINENNLRGLP